MGKANDPRGQGPVTVVCDRVCKEPPADAGCNEETNSLPHEHEERRRSKQPTLRVTSYELQMTDTRDGFTGFVRDTRITFRNL